MLPFKVLDARVTAGMVMTIQKMKMNVLNH